MAGEATDGALKSAKVRGPEQARLAGGNHRISGRRTAASMSSWALFSSIIDPAAAEDASHASCSSPETAACLRVLTAVSARFTALMSSACAGFSSSGTANHVQGLGVGRQSIAEADEHRGVGPGESLDVVEAALRSHHAHSRMGATLLLVRAIARGAFVPLIAREPQPASRIQLNPDLLDQRVDFFGPFPSPACASRRTTVASTRSTARTSARPAATVARFKRGGRQRAVRFLDSRLLRRSREAPIGGSAAPRPQGPRFADCRARQ